MRDPVRALLSAVHREEGGLAVVWCPADLGRRDELVELVEDLLVDEAPERVADVEGALVHPDRTVLLVPRDEPRAIEELDGSRDRIFQPDRPRTRPIVLFLMRTPATEAAWRRAPSLAGVAAGSTPEPDAIAEAWGARLEE